MFPESLVIHYSIKRDNNKNQIQNKTDDNGIL